MEIRPLKPPFVGPDRLARMQSDAAQERRECVTCGAHLYVSPLEKKACSNCGCRDLGPIPPDGPGRTG